MEATVREVGQVRPMSTDEKRGLAPSDVDVLREQRIRFDGYFTGPTW
jgi:hypothetical protein